MELKSLKIGDWFKYQNAYFIRTNIGEYCFLGSDTENIFKSGSKYFFFTNSEIEYIYELPTELIGWTEYYQRDLSITNSADFKIGDIISAIDDAMEEYYLILVIDKDSGIVLTNISLTEQPPCLDLEGCGFSLKHLIPSKGGLPHSNLKCKEIK